MDKKIRNNSYDLLRVISCMAVIVNHSFGYPPENIKLSPVWYIGGLLTYFAVPCFFMLSGAFVLDKDKNINFSYFYEKNLTKIIRCLVTTVIFYFLYTCICAFRFDQYGEIIKYVKNLLRGAPLEFLWYMTVLIMLYVLTPFIICLKKQISLSRFALIALIILIIGMICEKDSTVYYNIGQLKYISYFMLGYVIRKVSLQVLDKFPELTWGGIAVIVIAIIYGLIYIHGMDQWNLPAYYVASTYFSLFLVPYSIMIFIGFSLIRIKFKIVIAKYTFFIYCIHAYTLGKFVYSEYVSNIYLNKWIVAVMTFGLSLLIAFVHGKLCYYIKNNKITHLL